LTVGLLHRATAPGYCTELLHRATAAGASTKHKVPSTNSRRMPMELHPLTGEVPGSSPGGPPNVENTD